MGELIARLKACVVEASKNLNFRHHEWFIEYHLEFVEKLALELCDIYGDADRDIVLALVWIHDYAKILDQEHEHDEALFEKGREKMLELGFPNDFVKSVIDSLALFERKLEVDLNSATIEVKIVSSADAASHMIGPFFSLYYKENPDMTVEELMEATRKKLAKDWDRKIVLPEVRNAFAARHTFLTEQAGAFPEKYLT